MEVFGILEPGSMATIVDYPGGHHDVVMEYYERLVIKYNKDMFFPMRKQPAKTRFFMDGLEGNEDNKEDDKISGNESSSASLLDHVSCWLQQEETEPSTVGASTTETVITNEGFEKIFRSLRMFERLELFVGIV
jgi:hypothetical protein